MEISRHRGLPGGRAVLGGVLMAVAVVGVFLAYEQAGQAPDDAIVVADPGHPRSARCWRPPTCAPSTASSPARHAGLR